MIVVSSDVGMAKCSSDIIGIGQSRRLPHLQFKVTTKSGLEGLDSPGRTNREFRSTGSAESGWEYPKTSVLFMSKLGKPSLWAKARGASPESTHGLNTSQLPGSTSWYEHVYAIYLKFCPLSGYPTLHPGNSA